MFVYKNWVVVMIKDQIQKRKVVAVVVCVCECVSVCVCALLGAVSHE